MLDTRFGASLTFAMLVIVAMLCIFVYGVTNIVATQGLIPNIVANVLTNTTSNDAFGTLVVHAKTGAFKSALEDKSCQSINIEGVTSKLDCNYTIVDETSPEFTNDFLFCSIDITCEISQTISGNQEILFELPSAFQTMKWSANPGKSWNFFQVQLNHTLSPSNNKEDNNNERPILSGSKLNPTSLNFGLQRSKYMDYTNLIDESTPSIDLGIQLEWTGTKRIESSSIPSNGLHYVAFRFDVSPSFFLVETKYIKDDITRAITVLTLFLSIIGGMRTFKIFCGSGMDKYFIVLASKFGRKLPDDVKRRKGILEEEVISGPTNPLEMNGKEVSAQLEMVEVGKLTPSTSSGGNQGERNVNETMVVRLREIVETLERENKDMKRQMKNDKEEMKRQMNAMEKTLKNLTAYNKETAKFSSTEMNQNPMHKNGHVRRNTAPK